MKQDAAGDFHSELLDQFDWLAHGFGSRISTPPPWELATVKQIHSARILDACGTPGAQGEADALIANSPGLAVGIKTADCVPLLLVDRKNRVFAAIHAGWRGTAAEIARLTVERMRENYETNPADLFAAIGPAIGECCFEVGPEVAREFSKWDGRPTLSKVRLNLSKLNATQLIEAGVPETNIDPSAFCTLCRNDLFFSFRKEREAAGRMMSWIALKE
jgi:YfiH family protein